MSLRALAQAVGIDKSRLSRYESGKGDLSGEERKRVLATIYARMTLAQRFHLSPDSTGDAVSNLRQLVGLTQEDLGRRIGLSNVAVSQLESSETQIGDELSSKINAALRGDLKRVQSAEKAIASELPQETVTLIQEKVGEALHGPAMPRLSLDDAELLSHEEVLERVADELMRTGEGLLSLRYMASLVRGEHPTFEEVRQQIAPWLADAIKADPRVRLAAVCEKYRELKEAHSGAVKELIELRQRNAELSKELLDALRREQKRTPDNGADSEKRKGQE